MSAFSKKFYEDRKVEKGDNYCDDIEKETKDEKIEAIVIGHWQNYGGDDPIPDDKLNVILSWDDAKKLLEYGYYDGYGGVDCHPVVIWTTDNVIIPTEYDGATGFRSAPRNPIDMEPGFY